MKVGDNAKGFKFTDQNGVGGLGYHEKMEKHIGMTGTIFSINNKDDWFTIQYEFGHCYAYPLTEYLQIIREEKLNELGI